jgi:hypothetical protein
MSYENDVFISYKRERNWTPWTRDHFKTLLQSYLQQELGREPRIFIDEKLDENFGHDWVVELASNLARSRVAIVLFSRDYFGSDWCLHELDLMLGRIRGCAGGPYQLILPVVGHDGELIPDEVARLTPCDVKRFRIAHICVGTPEYQQFSVCVGSLSPVVARAINTAPEFNSEWVDVCVRRFNEVYEAQRRGDHLRTMDFIPKAIIIPTIPPRLNP